MGTREKPARAASRDILRSKLLVTVALAGLAIAIPAVDGALALDLGGLRLGKASTPAIKPTGYTVPGNGRGTGVGIVPSGKVTPVKTGNGSNIPIGHVDPGKGHVITGHVTTNGGDHPIGGPRVPFVPRPNFTPPVVVTTPPTIVHPIPVIGNPNPVIVNPNPIIANPQPTIPTLPVRRGGGVPPADERGYVQDEVVIEVARTMTLQQVNVLLRRHRLAVLQSVPFQLGGSTLIRARITDRRAVPAVVQGLEADATVLTAQPNYLYRRVAERAPAAPEGDPSQYILDKMHLPQAHTLATGDKVLVAVIDSGIDVNHPDLAGDIAGTFDAIGKGVKVHSHGTAIAGAIAAHGKLMGAAPAARILAIRAFSGTEDNDGTTVAVAIGLDWAVSHGARIVNMSFAGPEDPGIGRAVSAAYARGVVLVAATGNQGANSKKLYPAADPEVIAVTATDEHDQMPTFANRGDYVAVAAPGVDLMLLGPNSTYQMSSGTSFSSAYVSGTAALMIERQPGLTPDSLRQALTASAHNLGGKDQFGAGLVDAYQAVLSVSPPVAMNGPAEAATPVAARP
jgi:hypothetical protein